MSLQSPTISVVMPVYNSGRFLKEAIDSILEQTFTDFEFIIINDGSGDNSKSILEEYTDPRIRILTNTKNRGLVYSLNRGVQESRGEFIARFDADDISHPERFDKQIEFLKANPAISGCSTFVDLIDIYGNKTGVWNEDRSTVTEAEIRNCIVRTNCLAHPAMMIRSRDLKKFAYRHELKLSEDWGLWLEMLSAGYRFAKLPEVLLRYRLHPQSVTHKFNVAGPFKKIILFKIAYLKRRVTKFRFNHWDLRILFSLLLSILAYPLKALLRPFLSRTRMALSRKPWRFLSVLNNIKSIPSGTRVLFVFPYYHTGGAENVHYSVAESVLDTKPVVLFTSKSKDEGYKDSFNSIAQCIDISDFADFPLLKKILLKTLAGKLNKLTALTVFSSNTSFFYYLLPLLSSSVKKVDLIHAFVDELEDGPEKWSLPYVSLLDARVFVSKHAQNQMLQWYNRHQVSEEYNSRLQFVRNFTFLPPSLPAKSTVPPLKVVYIGRAGIEKRVPLLLQVVSHFRDDSGIRFTFIGDMEKLVPDDLHSVIELPGTIKADAIRQYLSDSHLLLLASSREGMPMVIFEAMAHGVIPVSTAVGDVPEYIRDGETGFLLPLLSEKELIRQFILILEKLKNNPASINHLSRNVYEMACEEFDHMKFTESYRKVLLS
jgi:glycosyltransferase involved in cell wall biosynthesis